MAWLLLAFMSAALLGCYDSFKKQALKANAVIPVLFLNTLFSSLIFLPFIMLSATTDVLDGSIFHVVFDRRGNRVFQGEGRLPEETVRHLVGHIYEESVGVIT